MKTWLTVAEGAEYAGVSRDTIYTACERRELGHVRIGGRRAIRLKTPWIDAWLERHTLAVQERQREVAHCGTEPSRSDSKAGVIDQQPPRAAAEDRTSPERNRQIPTMNCATLRAPRILDTRIGDPGDIEYRTTGRGRRHRGASGNGHARLVGSQWRNGHDAS